MIRNFCVIPGLVNGCSALGSRPFCDATPQEIVGLFEILLLKFPSAFCFCLPLGLLSVIGRVTRLNAEIFPGVKVGQELREARRDVCRWIRKRGFERGNDGFEL